MTTLSSAAAPAVSAVIERLQAWPGEHRVAVGLSGGVDSSLTAALLRSAQWQVEGLTLWLMSGKGACCAEGGGPGRGRRRDGPVGFQTELKA